MVDLLVMHLPLWSLETSQVKNKIIGGLLIIKVEENVLSVVCMDTLSVIVPLSLVVIQKTDWCYGC